MKIFEVLDIPTWQLILIFIVLLSYLWYKRQYSVFSSQGIPGPTPYPVLRNVRLGIRKGIIADELDNFKKYGKVYGTYVFGRPMFVLSDDELLNEVFVKRFWDFPDRWTFVSPALYISLVFGSMMNTLRGNDWKRVRNLLTPTFSSGKLKLMVKQMNKCCAQFTKNILKTSQDKNGFDAKETSGCFTMDVIGSTAFGLDMNSLNDPENIFVTNARKAMYFSVFSLRSLIVLLTPFLLPIITRLKLDFLVDLEVLNFFKQVTQEAISRRKTESGDKRTDLIQLMINAHNDVTDDNEVRAEASELGGTYDSSVAKKGLSEDEVSAQGILFFLAGFETSANTMSFMMHTLATKPIIQEKLYKEIMEAVGDKDVIDYDTVMNIEYLDMFINEIMRVFTIAPILTRVCERDVTINGIHIKKGQMVTIPVLAIHYDEKRWKNPEQFDPERFSPENKQNIGPFDWLPFGYGPRNCIGMRLAMLEAKLAISHILRSVKLVPSPNTKVPLKFAKSGFHVREGVWIAAEPRK